MPKKEPMVSDFAAVIAAELSLRRQDVAAVLALLEADATVPFIARYRKEATGGLDEVAIAAIRDRQANLRKLQDRKAAVLKSLEEHNLLTPDLAAAVSAAESMAVLEDLYLPYRPKRRTRAMAARVRGLGPLAALLLEQRPETQPKAVAAEYVDAAKGVTDSEAALAGARDIIAETVAEDAATRGELRTLFWRRGRIASSVRRGQQEAGVKYRDYYDWSEPVQRAASHRVLAMFRGEQEKILSVSLRPPEGEAMAILRRRWLRGDSSAARQVAEAMADGYERLLAPSLENEARAECKRQADSEAIRVFAQNLGELLLAPPLGRKVIMGLDPGFRTGCKTVILDRQGKLLHDTVIFPTQSQSRAAEAAEQVRTLCDRYGVEAIAIGNGTASRETEAFVRGLGLPPAVLVVMVNEAGASVYSASEVARQEFPDKDATVRGAVSIARRLMDPLAELVKIDPKAIGVGQYQHDVDQKELKAALDAMVERCVNRVGVDVNTASVSLLAYVSGLNATLARNIVTYRDSHGPFAERRDLLKVPRLGPKAFEQAAGFLRIRGGKQPLDASGVHPERYSLVERIAADLGRRLPDLIGAAAVLDTVQPDRYVDDSAGLPTIQDILEELAKPGRDPRAEFEPFSFAENLRDLDDVQPGMVVPGIITNVANFGAFVDIGVHHDGLVHVSQFKTLGTSAPAIRVGQKVTVKVLAVDLPRRRISLTFAP
ncbi:MAG: RNA-binding transcriptional accessory protein [Planctomycetes bacterium]|nr:RNA-binding transcriptional accessory protein [Planctomycetota bacterium]